MQQPVHRTVSLHIVADFAISLFLITSQLKRQSLTKLTNQFPILAMSKAAALFHPLLSQKRQCALQQKQFFEHDASLGLLHCRPVGREMDFPQRLLPWHQPMLLHHRKRQGFSPGNRLFNCFGDQFSQCAGTDSLRQWIYRHDPCRIQSIKLICQIDFRAFNLHSITIFRRLAANNQPRAAFPAFCPVWLIEPDQRSPTSVVRHPDPGQRLAPDPLDFTALHHRRKRSDLSRNNLPDCPKLAAVFIATGKMLQQVADRGNAKS